MDARGLMILVAMGVAVAAGAVVALGLKRPQEGDSGLAASAPLGAPAASGPARQAVPEDWAGLRRRMEALEDEIRALRERLGRGDGPRGAVAAPAAAPPAPTLGMAEAPPPRQLAGKDIEALGSPGGRSDLVARFGAPEKEEPTFSGGAELRFLQQGVLAKVDSTGRLESLELFGEPRSPLREQAGQWRGLFLKDAEWYRPKKWTVDGMAIGDHVQDVYQRWGDPDRVEAWQDGQEWAVYAKRKLMLEVGPDHRVRHIRFDRSLQ
ncbi:MAG: hypothetical protein L0216_05620 [Planctomycetales bacterium]|nr:hypothetical protein [Planctomycetales bacterium]